MALKAQSRGRLGVEARRAFKALEAVRLYAMWTVEGANLADESLAMSAQLLASSKGCSRVGTNAVYDAFAGLDGSLRN